MPSGFPFAGGLCQSKNLGTPGSFTTITPGATVNTKTSPWTTMTPTGGCPINVCRMEVVVYFNPQTAAQTLVNLDIGLGTVGNEDTILPDIIVDAAAQFQVSVFNAELPVQIAKGTRIAARCASNAASGSALNLTLNGWDGGFDVPEGYAKYDMIGTSGTPLLGTQLTPNATFLVKGAYQQLIAKTVRPYSGFVLNTDMRGIAGGGYYLIDVAVGGAGNEVPIKTDFTLSCRAVGSNSTNSVFQNIPIAQGERISARCSSASSSDTHTIGVSLLAAW